MAKPQFNQRQKDISRLVRDQRMRQGERLKVKGGFSPVFFSEERWIGLGRLTFRQQQIVLAG